MNSIRHSMPAALWVAVAAIAAAPSAALSRAQTELYPICAYGRTLYAPFPGDEDDSPKHSAGCHAARIDEKARLGVRKPKQS